MSIICKKSKLHGMGVFASSDIKENQVIETCQIIKLNQKDRKLIDKTSLYNYYFSWEQNTCAIALGLGSVYNHAYEPNAKYVKDYACDVITIIAIKQIRAGDEITVNYNGDPTNFKTVWFEEEM